MMILFHRVLVAETKMWRRMRGYRDLSPPRSKASRDHEDCRRWCSYCAQVDEDVSDEDYETLSPNTARRKIGQKIMLDLLKNFIE